ncbi:MBL fold metallo-hydrolase [Phreatobacter sp.]|uniref:MBL fold metallo-hydrolase n=1 Tax=Phreatobacter sp. TaxID=1966341 RepID=UPI0022CC0636|nr:MBL fold metallo-hydrolase [Phreatobacter sp.]MCZ8314308.1 MBL fold metallo-hydrolase [Phreatobacter sp.]
MFFRKSPTPPLRAEAVDPSRRDLLAMAFACCAMAALPADPVRAQSAAVQRHLAAARAAAGDDLLANLRLSEIVAPTPGARPMSPDELMRLPAPPPGKAFDNLFFVGSRWVSAWALVTSEGIILIDAMDNDDEAEHIVDAGMRRLGLDPAAIKMVIVTHGHGDHYGGVGYLKRRYAPRIVASSLDWTMMETQLEFDRPDWGRPPQRDMAVEDGSVLRLGDTSVAVILTPGHTMGTISLAFDVRDGARTHRALLWGGTAFNFGRRPDRLVRLQAYIDGTARVRDRAGREGMDVFISNHPIYDEAVDKLARMGEGRPNPFVIGTAATQRALTVMHECARATMEAWKG